MENFNIPGDGGTLDPLEEEGGEIETPGMEGDEAPHPEEGKKKGGKKGRKPMDLSPLDEKSFNILAKFILGLMELDMSIYDFFDG